MTSRPDADGATATFLREFIVNPGTTGSIIPSSRFLARTIVDHAKLGHADTILEYGPGTGVLTELILRDLKPGARFAAIELNPQLAAAFRSRFPDTPLYEESAVNVESICARAGIASVDCIVSGLPWATFPEPLQLECLEAMMRVLKPGGRFVTFTYVHSQVLPGARRIAKLLPRYFSTVSKSPVVWLNLPPAFAYLCRR